MSLIGLFRDQNKTVFEHRKTVSFKTHGAMFEDLLHQQRVYRKVFDNPDGELVLQDLARVSGFFETAVDYRGAMQLNATADELLFAEGMRSVIKHIMVTLSKDMELNDDR